MSSAAQTLAGVTPDCCEEQLSVGGATHSDVSELASVHDSKARGAIRLTRGERLILVKRARRTLAARVVLRSRIVLLAAEGVPPSEIARRLGTTTKTTALWLRRFEAGGLDALTREAPGRGRKRSIPSTVVDAVRAGLRNRLTVREIARRTGISPASVVRLSNAKDR